MLKIKCFSPIILEQNLNKSMHIQTGARRVSSLFLFLLALSLAITVPSQELQKAKPEDVGLSSQRLGRLTEMLDNYAKDGRLAGGVALVIRRGKVAYLHAFGQRDR